MEMEQMKNVQEPIEGMQELLEILRRSDYNRQADEIAGIVDYLHEMEANYSAMSAQLESLQEQVSRMNAERPTVGEVLRGAVLGTRDRALEALNNAISDARSALTEMRDNLDRMRNRLADWTKETVSDFKECGVEALDQAFSKLHIRGALEAVSNSLRTASEKTVGALDALDRLENRANETRAQRGEQAEGRASLRQKLADAKTAASAHNAPTVDRAKEQMAL